MGYVKRNTKRLSGHTLYAADHCVEVGYRVSAGLNSGCGVQYAKSTGVGNGGHQFCVGNPR